MNTKLNTIEEMMPGRKYSFWADMKVNGWLLVAALMTIFGDSWLHHHKDSSETLRALIALIPLPASLLWIRSAARWIRGMDELQRRITISACLFATAGTLVIVTFWQRLNQSGIFEKDVNSLTGCYALSLGFLFFFYFVGNAIFCRRYK